MLTEKTVKSLFVVMLLISIFFVISFSRAHIHILMAVQNFVYADEKQTNSIPSIVQKWGYASLDELIKAGDIYALLYCSSEKNVISPEEKNKYYLMSAGLGFPYMSDIWISWGSDIFTTDEKGNSALHLASSAQSVYLVEHLINLGLNPNSRNKENYSPFHICAEYGTADVARMLIMKGANPILPLVPDGSVYSSPCLLAGKKKNFGVIRVLRAFDAHYSLSHAISFGDIETIDVYLKEHPEWLVSAPTRYSTPPVIDAVASNQKEVLLYLLQRGASLEASTIEGIKPLGVAILHKNKDMIRLLIDLGINVNGLGTVGKDTYPIEYAIEKSDVDIVKFLLDLGADVNCVNVMCNSESPLHFAVELKKKEIVQLLVERGANLNLRNKDGKSPLFIAVEIGEREIAEYLIQQGADLEITDRSRYTPLFIAVEKKNEEMAKWLVEKGANIQARNKDGKTVLHLASSLGLIPLMELFLMKGMGINETDRFGNTPLYSAIEAKQQKAVEFLVQQGADMNFVNTVGKTPLFVAVEVDSLTMAKYLVEHGAKTDVIDREQRTLIHVGACSENSEMIRWLEGFGLDLFAIDNKGNSALHYACQSGAVDTVIWLVGKKLPMNELNKDGYAPIHLACQRGHIMIVKELIDLGVDYKKLSQTGQSAIHLCAARGHWGPAQILILKGVDPNLPDNSGNTPLHHACMNGQERFVQLILTKRAEICVRNNSGKTPLDEARERLDKTVPIAGATMSQIRLFEGLQGVVRLFYAVICEEYLRRIEQNDIEGLKKLVEYYPDFKEVFYFGKAPIHRAIMKHSLEMVSTLTHCKVDLNVKELGIDGFTPLHRAVQERQINIVDILLKAGADMDARDTKGRTPQELAEALNYPEIAEYIKSYRSKLGEKSEEKQ
ncbi:MAG TPA: ankyrin repeat domain-containing protein [Candidatus Hydrogenedens sp.]|nr:ankyrin repeat domain-containing protein [Candidatus Hydrogenedens sp.]